MAIDLPKLPYALDALEPHMSRATLEFHYGKHHRKYVDTVNELIKGTDLENLTLEDMVQRATGKTFDNVAQALNHAFFWKCLSPQQQQPSAELERALARVFGSVESFRKQFTEAAAAVFGSGWTWLVMDDDGALEIVSTRNGDTPLTDGKLPLLTVDVWEHAYYLDYRNDRARYLQHFWPLVNWSFVAETLGTGLPTARRPGQRPSEVRARH